MWSSPSFWQWMWEIHLIQLIIAVLWQKNCEKSDENQIVCSLTEFRRQVVYLSCLSVTVTFFSCFTKIREYYYEEGMEEYYNLFFQDVLCLYSEQGVKVLAVLVIVIMLAAFYVITSKLQPKQQRYIMMITGKITNFVIILMTGWMMFFCIVEQFCQNQWYFIPDLFYVLVIGYGLRILLEVNHDQTGTWRII